jgi:Phage integrase family
VNLDAHTVEFLAKHRVNTALERWVTADDFVVQSVEGQVVHPDAISQSFDGWVRWLGLPYIGLHGLRHGWATMALKAGVPAKIDQERLGHSRVGGHHGHLQSRLAWHAGGRGRQSGVTCVLRNFLATRQRFKVKPAHRGRFCICFLVELGGFEPPTF